MRAGTRSRRWGAAVAGVTATAVTCGLTSCGHPVTANRTFASLVDVTVTQRVDASGVTHTRFNYQGALVDARKQAFHNTYFNENCDSVPGRPIFCLAQINTGDRSYVFVGQVAKQPNVTLPSAAADSPRATLTVTLQKDPKAAPETALLRLSLRTGTS
jgi:hypothetical protein